MQKNKTGPYFLSYRKVNPRQIKDLNVKSQAITILNENLENNIVDIRIDKEFRTKSSKAIVTKPKIGK